MAEAKLFFTKVPNVMSIDDVKNVFEQVGRVKNINYGKDNKFGFVTFNDLSDAEKAIAALDNKPPYFMKVDHPRKQNSFGYGNHSGQRDDKSDSGSTANSSFNRTANNNSIPPLMAVNNINTPTEYQVSEVISYLAKVKDAAFIQHLNTAAREYVHKNFSSINPMWDSFNVLEGSALKLLTTDKPMGIGNTSAMYSNDAESKSYGRLSFNKKQDYGQTNGAVNGGGWGDDDQEDSRPKWSQNSSASNNRGSRPERSERLPKPRNNYGETNMRSYGTDSYNKRPYDSNRSSLGGGYKDSARYNSEQNKSFGGNAKSVPVNSDQTAGVNDVWDDDEPISKSEVPKAVIEPENVSTDRTLTGINGDRAVIIATVPLSDAPKALPFPKVVKSIENRVLPPNVYSKVRVTCVKSGGKRGYVVLEDKWRDMKSFEARLQTMISPATNFVPEVGKICIGSLNNAKVRCQITQLGEQIMAKCIDSGDIISDMSNMFMDMTDESFFDHPAEAIQIEIGNDLRLNSDMTLEVKPLETKDDKYIVIAKAVGALEPKGLNVSAVKSTENVMMTIEEVINPSETLLKKTGTNEVFKPRINSCVSASSTAKSGFIETYWKLGSDSIVGSCVFDEFSQALLDIEEDSLESARNNPNFDAEIGEYVYGLRKSGEWARSRIVTKTSDSYGVALIDYGLKEKVEKVCPINEKIFAIPSFAVCVFCKNPASYVNGTFTLRIIEKIDEKFTAEFMNEDSTVVEVVVLKPFYADKYF